MEYAFIINPASGNRHNAARLKEELKKHSDDSVRVFFTEGEKDATVLADSIAKEAKSRGEMVNVYACGGDGTLQETAIGLLGHDNSRLGIIPVGSGNDFVRCFRHPENFKDINKQLEAGEVGDEHLRPVDVLEYSYQRDGQEVKEYAINGINIGFDGNTAILAHRLKELPLVQGTGSYVLAILVNLIQKKGANLKVYADGKEIHDGPLILCTAANGRFCGGGVESCPHAELDNGLIEVLLVKDITRRFFVRVFPAFKAGKLSEVPGVERYIIPTRAKEVTFVPNEGKMKFVADGEIRETGTVQVRVLPRALTILEP